MIAQSLAPLVLLALATPGSPSSETDARIADAARRIAESGLRDGKAYEFLTELCDDVGNRLSGSEGAAKAVAWAKQSLQASGADRVVLEDVVVPKWVRGDVERASIVEPAGHDLAVLALGGSIATPRGGITAEVMVVKTFDELRERSSEAKGKIVLFNRAMGEMSDDGKRELGYGDAVRQRTGGAIEAAKAGAVASVIRSVGTKGAEYRLPHTGMMSYEEGVKKIPHAALSAEDADLVARLLARRGKVVMHLELDCRDEGTAPSSNVVADLTGHEKPEEVVVVGGHLDSWDVGQGASDDGVGVVCSMEVIRLLKALDLRPRRTVRCVLFMNEENGLAGGKAYAKAHEQELGRHVAAIEMDSGAFGLKGFGVSDGGDGVARVQQLFAPIAELGPLIIEAGGGGADIGPMGRSGVPLLGVDSDGKTYFRYHHTAADTLDKVDPAELARHAAALAVLVYGLAEMDEPLARQPPKTDERR